MQKFTQKYVLVHTIKDLPNGYEYVMEDWPLHVTLADVFSIKGTPDDLLHELEHQLSTLTPVTSTVVGETWFGENQNVHVMLLEKTDALQQLHEEILSILDHFNVQFNDPQYTRGGFRPHSTVQKNEALALGDTVTFDSITLIDLFPDEKPYRRRILGTVYFSVL